VLAAVVSFIVVFLYCVCALFVCNVCYLYVVLLYYCHRAKTQLQFNNIYIYIYIYIYREREREREREKCLGSTIDVAPGMALKSECTYFESR
jgi:hypothetical protein